MNLVLAQFDNEEGRWYITMREIWPRYLAGWFTVDLVRNKFLLAGCGSRHAIHIIPSQLSIVPFDAIGFLLHSDVATQARVVRILRVLRVLRLVRLLKTAKFVAVCTFNITTAMYPAYDRLQSNSCI